LLNRGLPEPELVEVERVMLSQGGLGIGDQPDNPPRPPAPAAGAAERAQPQRSQQRQGPQK